MSALHVKNLKKIYSNGKVALKGIDLNVAEGDFFALLGQNGAGKSTTIGIISSLITKTEGQVKIFDHDLDSNPNAAKPLIGVVPQEVNFNSFEKIIHILVNQAGYYGIPRKIAFQQAEIFLKRMGLWDMREQPAILLSGGMKRRLLIARGLVHQPKLLILDEPTAGVDIELRHNLWQFLIELNQQGTTIILTTHYLEEAEHLCKHLAIIDRGEIIENANMKELINRLHVQTLILDLVQPITESPNLDYFQCRLIDSSTLEVEVRRGQALNELFEKLSQRSISIHSMRNKTNRLEELFIHLIAENKAE